MFTHEPAPEVKLRPRVTSPVNRRTVRVAIIVGVLLIVGGGIQYWTSRTPDEVPAPTVASAPVVEVAPVVPPGQTCAEFPSTNTDLATLHPEWTMSGYTEVPASPGVGPAFTDPIRWCYAHTLPGALFAAVNFIGVMAVASPTTIATFTLADTTSRGQVLTAAKLSAGQPAVPTDATLRWLGYHVVAYDETSASIDVLHRYGDAPYTAAVYDLIWEGGDWKLIYPETFIFPNRELPSVDPTYWTLWGNLG